MLHIYHSYGVATVSRIDKITGLFCRISSLLWVSFAKETYKFIEPTNCSHPIRIQVPTIESKLMNGIKILLLCTHAHTHLHTHTHTHTCACTHTHVHTHPCTCNFCARVDVKNAGDDEASTQNRSKRTLGASATKHQQPRETMALRKCQRARHDNAPCPALTPPILSAAVSTLLMDPWLNHSLTRVIFSPLPSAQGSRFSTTIIIHNKTADGDLSIYVDKREAMCRIGKRFEQNPT